MVEAPALDAIRSALAPVEELRGEQSQLETWVRESFATLESLHDELAQWQQELARQQEELDQRFADAQEASGKSGSGVIEDLQDRLARSQDAVRHFEEENAEQLHAIAELDRQLIAAEAELRATRTSVEELLAALDAERQRSLEEQRLWVGELREMRLLLERQGAGLVSLGNAPDAADDEGGDDAPEDASGPSSNDQAARAAELRRRAATRRVQRRTA